MRSDIASDAEREKLADWTYAAGLEMIQAGYVEPPIAFSDDMYGYLIDLYLIGFTPSEAAQAAFATRH